MTDSSEAARDRILDAASSVFAEAGYGGARVDEIARRAGVNKAMLYYRIGGKEALYEQVFERNLRILARAMDDSGIGATDAVDRLRRLIAAMLATLKRMPDHPRLMLHEVATFGKSLPRPVLEQLVGIFRRVQTILMEGQRSQTFRSVDPVLTHLTIIGGMVFLFAGRMMAGRIVRTVEDKPALPAGDVDLAEHLSRLILQGIQARPVRRARSAQRSSKPRNPRRATK